MHRCRCFDWRVEIIAERRPERLLVTFVDRDQIHHRRPQILGVDREHLRDGLGLGVEAVRAPLGLGQGDARCLKLLARGGMRAGRRLARGLCLGQSCLYRRDRSRKFRQVGSGLALRFELGELGLDLRDFRLEPRDPLGLRLCTLLQLVAACGQLSEFSGQLGENLLGPAEDFRRRGHPLVDAAAPFGIGARLLLEACFLGEKPLQRGPRIGRVPLLALDIGVELMEPPLELGDTLLGPRLFALERVAGQREPMQNRRGLSFRLAQLGKLGRDQGLLLGGLGLLAGALGDDARRRHPCRARLRAAPRWPPRSADETTSPRPCAPAPRRCGSGWPAGPDA